MGKKIPGPRGKSESGPCTHPKVKRKKQTLQFPKGPMDVKHCICKVCGKWWWEDMNGNKIK